MRIQCMVAIFLGVIAVGCGGGAGEITTPVPSEPLPVVASFGASPGSIAAGQSTTLSWAVSGASSVVVDNGVGAVTGTSSRVVAPVATTTYLLTASNGAGSVSMSVTVTVGAASPYPAGLS